MVQGFEIQQKLNLESETSSLSGFAPIPFKATPAEKTALTVVRKGQWEGSGRADTYTLLVSASELQLLFPWFRQVPESQWKESETRSGRQMAGKVELDNQKQKLPIRLTQILKRACSRFA